MHLSHRTILLLSLTLALDFALITAHPFTHSVHADVAGPSLAVDVMAARHFISPDIYGMNSYGVDTAVAREIRVPVQRWGGDATTRYNWQLDSSNAGGDWYFMGGNGATNPTPGAGADAFVASNQAVGSKSILTIPIIGWVNKLSEWNCSFPVSVYGAQQSTNPYVHPNGDSCGNGLTVSGTPIADTTVGSNNLQVTPAWMQGWIQHLVATHATAANGGVGIYQLDNEPSGWSNTHRDIHPGPTGYAELVNASEAYAAMIKSVDPSANVLGPSDFGYPAYYGMGKPGDDATSHGVGLAEYYLRQMHQYEIQHGVRLLNYFDEHYYPNEVGVALSPAGDAATQALRLRSTRSLWDPTYSDESWIGQWNPPIQLLPTFKKWIATDYPGTKIGITEYNWGGLESINGALAEADVLGIFGREGLDLATMWSPPTSTQPGAYAFRMFRNYDGQGGSFGETSIRSASADQSQLAIYGAQRPADGALTLLVINKTGNALSSSLTLSNCTCATSAQVYRYGSDNLASIVRQADQPLSGSGLNASYPANSLTLLVIPSAAVIVPTATASNTPQPPSSTPTFIASTPPPATPTSTVVPTHTAAPTFTVAPTHSVVVPSSTPTHFILPGITATAVLRTSTAIPGATIVPTFTEAPSVATRIAATPTTPIPTVRASISSTPVTRPRPLRFRIALRTASLRAGKIVPLTIIIWTPKSLRHGRVVYLLYRQRPGRLVNVARRAQLLPTVPAGRTVSVTGSWVLPGTVQSGHYLLKVELKDRSSVNIWNPGIWLYIVR